MFETAKSTDIKNEQIQLCLENRGGPGIRISGRRPDFQYHKDLDLIDLRICRYCKSLNFVGLLVISIYVSEASEYKRMFKLYPVTVAL